MTTKKKPEPGTTPLRVARDAAGVSRQAVADALGVPLSRAWALETGKREATPAEVKEWHVAVKKAAAAAPKPEPKAKPVTKATAKVTVKNVTAKAIKATNATGDTKPVAKPPAARKATKTTATKVAA